VEGSLLVVERNPAVARRRAKDVIGDLDIGVAEIFRRLRPVADLRGIVAYIERREEGIELHVGPPTGSGRSLSGHSFGAACSIHILHSQADRMEAPMRIMNKSGSSRIGLFCRALRRCPPDHEVRDHGRSRQK